MAQLLRLGSSYRSFAQLTYRESLRDIEACLGVAFRQALPHGSARWRARHWPRHTNRWRIYADFAQVFIRIDRPLYARDPIGVHLDQVSLWTRPPSTCASRVPVQVPPAQGCCEDAHAAGQASSPRLSALPTATRARSAPSPEPSTSWIGHLREEEHLAPTALLASRRQVHGRALGSDRHPGRQSAQAYPDPLRRVSYFDTATNKRLQFLTNNFVLPALTMPRSTVRAGSCSSGGWDQEVLLKTQIWIAVSVYVLVAIVRKKAKSLPNPTDSRVTLFEKTPILQALQPRKLTR